MAQSPTPKDLKNVICILEYLRHQQISLKLFFFVFYLMMKDGIYLLDYCAQGPRSKKTLDITADLTKKFLELYTNIFKT